MIRKKLQGGTTQNQVVNPLEFLMIDGRSKKFNLVSQKSQHPQRMMMQQLTKPRSLFNSAAPSKSQQIMPGWGQAASTG